MLRVLAIDDDPAFLFSLRLALAPAVVLAEATTAEEALRMLKVEGPSYDHIVCDLTMPGSDGVNFYHTLASWRPELLSRLVFTTGGACSPRAQMFLDRIRPRVVQKPFFPEELLAAFGVSAAR